MATLKDIKILKEQLGLDLSRYDERQLQLDTGGTSSKEVQGPLSIYPDGSLQHARVLIRWEYVQLKCTSVLADTLEKDAALKRLGDWYIYSERNVYGGGKFPVIYELRKNIEPIDINEVFQDEEP